MNEKDKLNNKVAVSASSPTICSADAPGRNAERKTPEYYASEIIETYFGREFPNEMLRAPFLAKLIVDAIREARQNK